MARDASRSLGGGSGRAASALRGRGSAIDRALEAAGDSAPSRGKAKKITIKEGRSGKKKYR